jgi:hypothetical protein
VNSSLHEYRANNNSFPLRGSNGSSRANSSLATTSGGRELAIGAGICGPRNTDEIVEFTPVGEGDEEGAEQATDYVNYVILPECGGRQSIEDAINDALRLRNGIIKWWYQEKIEVRISRHTGLDEMSFAQLVSDDEVEVLEHTEGVETIEVPDPATGQTVAQDAPVHDVKIRRRSTKKQPRVAAIAPEKFLVHPDAIRLEDSPIVGEVERLRRSDLVSMGYDLQP